MATYELIETITLGSNAASVTFSDIPQTYTDLKLVHSLRCTRASIDPNGGGLLIKFNGVSGGGVYSSIMLRGNGSAASSPNNGTGYAGIYIGEINSLNNVANSFASGEVHIPNYTGSTQKIISATTVSENNATTAYIEAVGGKWVGTSAITSITIAEHAGTNFVTNSSLSLYGIKKA